MNELIKVSKPARYIGGELNSVIKDEKDILNFCLIFPDIYEIGSSHVGYRILYELVNKSDKIYCQRFFAPWKDALDTFASDIFISLEKKRRLKDFDVLGFSLHYEMSYTTALAILKYSSIPLRSGDRDNSFPIIIAGGSCVYNPAPLKPFIDAFYVGEGDIGLRKILEDIKDMKDRGADKLSVLKHLNSYPFIYVPSVEPDKNVKRDVFLDFHTVSLCRAPVVPLIPAVQDRVAVEIARGCTAGCRFCQAGMIYRPVRERGADLIVKDAKEQLQSSGYSEVSLLSLSTGDFSQIEPLIINLNKELRHNNISLSTPSLRADSVSDNLFKEISKVRKSGFTIAPEAGSQRMRDAINKNLSEEDILRAVKLAAENGYSGVKLYFMIGFPFERDEDVLGIALLASKIRETAKSVKKGGFDVSVSVSHFVPKPHTPFQRMGQVPKGELERRMYMLKDELKRRRLKFKFHDTRMSAAEALLSRGDRRIADFLEYAVLNGFYLDAWDDFFNYDEWVKACAAVNINLEEEASKSYSDSDKLPWGNISCGISDKFYKKELDKAYAAALTEDCRQGKCSACGVCDFQSLKPQKSAELSISFVEDTVNTGDICRYEVIYSKKDGAVYFSALDMIRIFTHSLIVSGAALTFSQGFNPHPKINTWIPLPVGMKGENEVMCFEADCIDTDNFLDVFNGNLPAGLRAKTIRPVAVMKTGTEFVSEYMLSGASKTLFNNLMESGNAVYLKKDKKGNDKEINIKDYLVSYDKDSGVIALKAGSAGGFNIMECLKRVMPVENIDISRIKVSIYGEYRQRKSS